MNYKLAGLKKLVYNKFIRGEFGKPKIPNDSEILYQIRTNSPEEYIPLLDNKRLDDIDFSGIRSKFSNIIDDISILFNSVELESKEVLDQLTNSIKEYNGVKRELKRIKTEIEDINNGKIGERYLQYNFTETFNNLENIDHVRSDPVNTDSEVFTIDSSSATVVNMNHYIGRRLEFSVINNLAPIVDQGYVGDSNADNILTRSNPKSILYRVRTSYPTALSIVTSIQLRPDGKPVNINNVIIAVDSGINAGYIKIMYQNNSKWMDVNGKGLQEIKGDLLRFSFSAVEATHIRIEFIKDKPDVPTTNEYYVQIYELVVCKSAMKSSAVLYSKPITIEQYDKEQPIINSIECFVDADVPPRCGLKVYVAPDIYISGAFVDSNGNKVHPNSINIADFDHTLSGVVYLSDILSKPYLSGTIPFRWMDFEWKEIKPSFAYGNAVPETIEFNFASRKDELLNSIYSKTNIIKYGDRNYLGPWPESPAYTGIYISGWCNESNPAWETVLKPLVASGLLVSGIDVASLLGIPWDQIADGNGYTFESGINPLILNSPYWSDQWLGYGSGYPYNYYNNELDRVIRYGDSFGSSHGWWRPYASVVTPTGIHDDYSESGYLQQDIGIDNGEFYFNGMSFYKIYRFHAKQTLLDSSIKLYQYETRPVSSDNDNYNHVFTWNYKTSVIEETNTLVNKVDPNLYQGTSFSGYNIAFQPLDVNESYSDFNVIEVSQYNSNFVLRPNIDYVVVYNSDNTISGVNLTQLGINFPSLIPNGMSFNIKYSYKIKNKYASSWSAYAIVAPMLDEKIIITNRDVYNKPGVKVIKEINVTDLDTGVSKIISGEDSFVIPIDTRNRVSNSHYKITIYCMADEQTGFCAKISENTYYIPKESMGTISVPAGIKIVSKLESLKVCSLGSLLYDTPMSNDKKCALITDYDGDKYIVIKKPSKDSFPGYMFDSIKRKYSLIYDAQIHNKTHFIRYGMYNQSGIYYTTGSSGAIVYDGLGEPDKTWNNGQVDERFKNTIDNVFFPNHSTYGHRLNLEESRTLYLNNVTLRYGDVDPRCNSINHCIVGSSGWMAWADPADVAKYNSSVDKSFVASGYYTNRGYLFYNTAENLPAFYSISYSYMTRYDEIAKRFLYKIELTSDDAKEVVPTVRSITFIVNRT